MHTRRNGKNTEQNRLSCYNAFAKSFSCHSRHSTDRLREIRKAHRLNQATFAEKAGISLSIYSKWEGGSRQPSRKMFRQLVNTYPEINI
ncbi:MAG: helix-turn-helix domain-containing protein [Coprococcus phoceensis]|uniref:helix-turn-helix domain-containing protein n=1 Tax=unclassified Coprococcus TaxID=2684943 RepID=UPI001A9A5951